MNIDYVWGMFSHSELQFMGNYNDCDFWILYDITYKMQTMEN